MSQPTNPLPNIRFQIARGLHQEDAEFVCTHQRPLEVLVRGVLFPVTRTSSEDLRLMISAGNAEQMAILNDLRALSGVVGEQDRSGFDFNPAPWMAYSMAERQAMLGEPAS